MGGASSASSSNESDDESLYGKVVKSEKERAFYEGRLTQDGWEISSDGQYMENKYGAGGLGITGERRAIRENDGHIVDEYGQRHIPATPFNTDKDDL